MKDFVNITPKQRRAIRFLLSCKTLTEAARKTGINQVTLWRWFQEPAFGAAYREASARTLDQAVGALQAGGNEAVEALREIVADKKANVAARVSAARTVLEMSLRCRELIEHEERIAELEQRIETLSPAQKLRAVK